MKIKNLISGLAMLLSVASAFAQIEVNGIYYNLLGTTMVEITKHPSRYAGDIVIPNTITYNGANYNVISIEDEAFYSSGLTSIIIPNSIINIGTNAFGKCDSLTSIDVDSENSGYSSADGVLFNEDKTVLVCYPAGKTGDCVIPNNVKSISEYAFAYCYELTSIIIPAGVENIGSWAFAYSQFTSIVIPNSVASIKDYTFYECHHLHSITISNNAISIGDWAFFECYSLTSITIPNSIASIGHSTFFGCSSLTSINVESENAHYSSEDGVLFNKDKTVLIRCPEGKAESYVIPASVTGIGDGAFFACLWLDSIDVPGSVTNIGGSTFFGCSRLTSLDLPNGITSIGHGTFQYCQSLVSITIPNSVTNIGNYAFYGCVSLASIDIPSAVTSIGEFAFSYCRSLTSIIIPDGITRINHATFTGCSGLTSVVIPSSVTDIGGWNTFAYCSALTSITNLNPVPVDIIPEVFEGMDQSACTLKVPAGSVSAYKNAEVWKEFNIAGIGEGIEPAEKDDFKIYPNPTCGELRIINYELSSNGACPIVENVEIYDMSGRMVKTQCIASLRDDITTIDISHLSTGVYFLRIQSETGTVTRKVVKQ